MLSSIVTTYGHFVRPSGGERKKAYEEQEKAANQNHRACAVSAVDHRSRFAAGADMSAPVAAVLCWPPFILCSLLFLLRIIRETKAGAGEKGCH